MTENAVSVQKIARMLLRRPPDGRLREQLFWLVDIVFACKASDDEELARHARMVESALGNLGRFVESGDREALQSASIQVADFARVIRDRLTKAVAKEE